MGRKLLRYAIAFGVMVALLLLISLISHWNYVSEYFSNSLYSLGSSLLLILIVIAGLLWIIKSVFK